MDTRLYLHTKLFELIDTNSESIDYVAARLAFRTYYYTFKSREHKVFSLSYVPAVQSNIYESLAD